MYHKLDLGMKLVLVIMMLACVITPSLSGSNCKAIGNLDCEKNKECCSGSCDKYLHGCYTSGLAFDAFDVTVTLHKELEGSEY